MLRKQSILVFSDGLLFLNPSPPPASRPPLGGTRLPRHKQPCRPYASVSSESDLSWPSMPSFTPYDLFNQKKNAPYSKSRFYELVKIYHPDRSCNGHPMCKDISQEVRLQRYRLIVSAHEILSDPVKRAAYDKYGAGWHSNPGHDGFHSRTGSEYPGFWKYTDREDPIFSNGTWEDWERWHHRHHPRQAREVSDGTFITFIILLALFGGVLQGSRLTQYRAGFEQRLQEVDAQSAELLAGRRQQTTDELNSSDARVQSFLIRRDPSGAGLKEDEEVIYRQVLDPRSSSALGLSNAPLVEFPSQGGYEC
ncbi:hypothetical protein Egran_06694 [Elaphomyces granulatus]|uniref:J domain-containing protein n=1 Tax=Elaphomyces granulatus TaxID=519963 RepID=A0A232LN00_9EURO|nr:hypothetical protein Egran_06694 [Elaphomyces granulatus]